MHDDPVLLILKKKLHESGTIVNLQISLSPSMSRLLVKGINWINEAILNGYRQSRCFFLFHKKIQKWVNPSLGFEKFLIENNNKDIISAYSIVCDVKVIAK